MPVYVPKLNSYIAILKLISIFRILVNELIIIYILTYIHICARNFTQYASMHTDAHPVRWIERVQKYIFYAFND